MNCTFEKIQSGQWRCTRCEYITKKQYEEAPFLNCTGLLTPAERIKRTADFAKALWIFAVKDKFQFASEKLIQERFEICKACPFFTGSKCEKCGCGTNGNDSLLNKLAHKSQQCPDKPPRW